MIKKLAKNYLVRRNNRRLKKRIPEMIYSYEHNGVIIPTTRVSNSSVINEPSNLLLGDFVFIGHFNFIESSNGIEISDGVQITNYVSILTHSSHNSIRLYGKDYQNHSNLIGYKKGKVFIGKYSFVGPHTTILPGASIGKGSLVKPYSLVKGEKFPDFSIIEGNPAKVVGTTKEIDKRFLNDHPELVKLYNQWAEEKK